jgi:hypothetical protein
VLSRDADVPLSALLIVMTTIARYKARVSHLSLARATYAPAGTAYLMARQLCRRYP